MPDVLSLSSIDVKGKRVLIRSDLNVPIKDGSVASEQRIIASLPTIEYCLQNGAEVMLMSHLGRPKAGQYAAEFSLLPVAKCLQQKLNTPVHLMQNWLEEEKINVNKGEIALLENVRFNVGETDNDEILGRKMANLCDIFIMDAFGTAHRAHSSTYAVAKYAPLACAGPLLMNELEALEKALSTPKKPLIALVGGAKVSTKLEVLLSLADKVDGLIAGGGIANTFMLANNLPIGKSLCEPELIDTAQKLSAKMHDRGATIPLVEDVVVADSLTENAKATEKEVNQIQEHDCILDLGKKTIDKLCELIHQAGTIVWNGPIGVFEYPQFAKGTERIAKAIANSNAFSIAGGGDTLAAIEKFGVQQDISYISTGGGAFLEFLEGKTLPSVAILQERKNS
jgi:phosphoglycerate kinase